MGDARLQYPDAHIEADNRLSWLLGRLDRAFGDEAVYVHLRRNEIETAESFVQRYHYGIITAYRGHIVPKDKRDDEPIDVALDYCRTVNSNISLFLRDKTKKMDFELENAEENFAEFWRMIGAEGDFHAALREWATTHNASSENKIPPRNKYSYLSNLIRRVR